MKTLLRVVLALSSSALLISPVCGQIGHRFPSEKKIVVDPVTGVPLTFLTSSPVGDSKIYQTHPQWTSDGKWLVFRSQRVLGQAFAVNEDSGVIVQLTESGYNGMLCVARKSMKLYFLRNVGPTPTPPPRVPGQDPVAARAAWNALPGVKRELIETDLAKLFADSEAGKMQPASAYERVCGVIPAEMYPGDDLALDANEDVAYFRVRGAEANHLPAGTKIADIYGPRNMGAGPAGLRSMNLATGEIKLIVDVPFQIGHVQSNPFVPGEIVFCWETGGKAPQRTWTVMADGTGLRPLYPEASYDWVTHEAVITKDEVAIAIMGHRKPGTKDEWGECGTREHPTGLGIVNLRTREMVIAGQTPTGSGLWHVNGSADGRWAVGDDFSRSIYLIDRHTREMMMLSTGHKVTAADHPHPTFNADGTKIEIQSAMLSPDGRSMNICVIKVPKAWLDRKYNTEAEKAAAGPASPDRAD